MYVVIEWNQASRRPRVVDEEIHENDASAVEAAAWHTANRGARRERYTVHAVDEDAIWDGQEDQ